MNSDARQSRARLAAARRRHPNTAETEGLARDFRAIRLAEHIRRVVDFAPPLSPEQRDRLAVLLRGAGSAT